MLTSGHDPSAVALRRRVTTMAAAPPSTNTLETAKSGTGDEPVDGRAVRASTLAGVVVGGAVAVSSTVGGAAVVGATVGGATVSGTDVVWATVVGAAVVAGGTVVGATVVGATVVVVGTGQAGMLSEAGHEGPAELSWADQTMMPAASTRPAIVARPNDRACRIRACVPLMTSA